jgi:hypothetical protein
MEAKQFLLRGLRVPNRNYAPTPDMILIDAGAHNLTVKEELQRWLETHPRLGEIKLRFPAQTSWFRRRWTQWIPREGTTATTA